MRRKVKKADMEGVKHLAAMETNTFGGRQAIVDHMAVTLYDDGTPRRPGWITIKTYGSAWQVDVKDPDTAQSMRVTAPNLDEALDLVALLIDAEEAPWEHDQWLAKQDKPTRRK